MPKLSESQQVPKVPRHEKKGIFLFVTSCEIMRRSDGIAGIEEAPHHPPKKRIEGILHVYMPIKLSPNKEKRPKKRTSIELTIDLQEPLLLLPIRANINMFQLILQPERLERHGDFLSIGRCVGVEASQFSSAFLFVDELNDNDIS